MKKPFSAPAIRDLLVPVAKLVAICAGVALALALVNLITAPVIEETKLREKNKVLAELSGNAVRSQGEAAFPLRLEQAAWDALLNNPRLTAADRSILARYYHETGGTHALAPDFSPDDARQLSRVFAKTERGRKDKVRAWYILRSGGTISGYILELAGSGYGGEIDIVAAYEPDGTVRSFRVLHAEESPAQTKMISAPDYDRHFRGTRGASVPVVKAMLSRKSADAVSGASISFMAVAAAIKEGSLFVMAQGGE